MYTYFFSISAETDWTSPLTAYYSPILYLRKQTYTCASSHRYNRAFIHSFIHFVLLIPFIPVVSFIISSFHSFHLISFNFIPVHFVPFLPFHSIPFHSFISFIHAFIHFIYSFPSFHSCQSFIPFHSNPIHFMHFISLHLIHSLHYMTLHSIHFASSHFVSCIRSVVRSFTPALLHSFISFIHSFIAWIQT